MKQRTFAINYILVIKVMATVNYEQARFDTRLTKQQKKFLEMASIFGGYKSFSDFVFQAATEKAKEILKIRGQVLTSEKDVEFFFNELMRPKSPNNSLCKAVDQYKFEVSE